MRTDLASRRTRTSAARRRRNGMTLVLEGLEDRTLLATFVVTNTSDNGGVNPAPGAGTGTLRQAIIDANNDTTSPGIDEIDFNMPTTDPGYEILPASGLHFQGATVWQIEQASDFPAIERAVTICGYSQPGSSPNTLPLGDNAVLKVELTGMASASVSDGLDINSDGCTVTGLVINGTYNRSDIYVDGNRGAEIRGNFLGTGPAGTDDYAVRDDSGSYDLLGFAAIYTTAGNAGGGPGNVIGTDGRADNDSAARNIINSVHGVPPYSGGLEQEVGIRISGNLGTVIAGNYIGMDSSGTRPLYGEEVGILIDNGSANNRIGFDGLGTGDVATRSIAERNVIDSFFTFGDDPSIVIDGGPGNNVVDGNYFGADVNGSAYFGEILIIGSNSNRIGTNGDGVSDAAERNLISGNGSISWPGYSAYSYGAVTLINANSTLVAGNSIGPNSPAYSSRYLGGVVVYGSNNTIGGTIAGLGNEIAFNHVTGVDIESGMGNAIRGNSIDFNTENNLTPSNHDGPPIGGIGIDLGGDGVTPNHPGGSTTGPNDWENDPVLTSATNSNNMAAIQGTLNSVHDATFYLDFYASPTRTLAGQSVQGAEYLGTYEVMTDGSGNAVFSTSFPIDPLREIITATATDADGNTSEFSAPLRIDNHAPVAVVSIEPGTTVNEGDTISFDGSGSTDADGDPLSYTWDFGDGQTATGPTVAHAYDGGVYTATLTVSDGVGAVSTRAVTVNAHYVQPQILWTSYTTQTGTSVPSPFANSFSGGHYTYLWHMTGSTNGITVPDSASQDFNFSPPYTAGTYDFHVTVTDNGAFSTSVDVAVTVNPSPTSTIIVASAVSSIFGQPVTITATIAPLASRAGFPSGTVTFDDGNTSLQAVPLNTVDGVTTAELTVSALTPGIHTISAVYSGDDDGFSSSSSPGSLSLTVVRSPTTTVITTSVGSPLYGQSVTLTATVVPVSPGGGTPPGTVEFYDGAVALGGAMLSTTNGVTTATFTTSNLAVGSHSITAVYSGNANYVGSVSREMSTVAGGGQYGQPFGLPGGVAVDSSGDLFVTDTALYTLFEITAAGAVIDLLPSPPFVPSRVAVDGLGDLFISDLYSSAIYEMAPVSNSYVGVTPILVGIGGGSGGGMAWDAHYGRLIAAFGEGIGNEIDEVAPSLQDPAGSLVSSTNIGSWPMDVAVDANGDVFVSDLIDDVVRELKPGADGTISSGTVSVYAGTGVVGYSGDGGPATAARLSSPGALAVDPAGDLFIEDSRNQVIREVTPDGTITTIAGNGVAGYGGDGGPATGASLSLLSFGSGTPDGLAVDSAGNLFITDPLNRAIRRAGGLQLSVQPVNATNLGAVLTSTQQQGAVTLQATSSSDVSTAVQAINGLTTPSAPETVTLDLAGAITTPTTAISAPSGVQVDLTSSTGNATLENVTVSGGTVVVGVSVSPVNWTVSGGNVTVQGNATAGDFTVNGGTVTLADGEVLTGNSPAIIVNGGTVILEGVTARTATNSPTIVVNGGNLIVRNSTIQESTGYAQAAILINGGAVDLGTTASPGGNTFNVTGTGTLIQNTSGNTVPATGDTFENNGTPVSARFGVVGLSSASAQAANQGVPRNFSLGSLTDTVNDSQSWAADVNWGDGSTDTTFNTTATGTLAARPHAYALPGSYTVTVTVTDPIASQVAAWSVTRTFAVSVAPSVFVLDPAASGALTLSGNAAVKIPGAVVVDSSSATAVSAAGNAQLTASVIDVAGGFKKTGNATFGVTPTTGMSLPDPLAGLSGPSTTGLTSYGSKSLSGNAQATIGPGIYSQITVSGNASLTMSAGIYIIEGGGLAVSGNASIVGSGVMIYNAGSNYPSSGGTFGGITLSGNGTFNLTAPTSGPYANVLIFQSRQNTRALSFSGNAMAGMSGTIYAASALLSMSGNSQLQNPLDVGTLNLSGNVSLTQMAAGGDGSGDASGIANTLLAGNLSAYVNDPAGLFTADELARIQDAINAWDAILVPYNVTITEVSDPSLANLVIDTGTTSASGTAANGVLGCYDASAGEVTILQGWNWYAGADPGQIGADQYDFQTTVTHELGHALGLGHSTDPASPMFATLATGVADRAVTTQDLNIPDPPGGADPQTAAGFRPIPATVIIPFDFGAETAAAGGVAMMPLDGTIAARDAVPTGGSRSGASASRRVTVQRPSLGKSFAVSGGRRITVFNARLVDSALDEIGATRSLLRRT